MKNNQCKECGLYYFQCKCHGRKGASHGKKKAHKSTRTSYHDKDAPNEVEILNRVHEVKEDTDDAIRRINEAEAEFFSDNEV